MEKVIAVVVTYNRPILLKECITALRNQTRQIDRILVINNGCTDNTEGWLLQQKDITAFTQNNLGSAGGFNTGITMAYEMKYDWIWLMDDDGYPKEDALENLLSNSDEKLCLRNCAVINKEDKKSFVFKTGKYTTIDEVKVPIINNVAHPFNGTLLHKSIIDKVGLPKKELFIWGDESEYRFRIITQYKISYYTQSNSIHYHPASTFSFKNDWDFTNNWKVYFYIRNRIHILKTKFSRKPFLVFPAYIGFLVAFIGSIIIFQKTSKFQKIIFLLWPAKDALTNNYQANPSMIIKKLSLPARFNLSQHLIYQIRQIKAYVFTAEISVSRELKKA